jgi:energy-coupling factor transport system ATP-binding protein
VISHDFVGLEELCPQTLHLRNGALTPAPTVTGGLS